MELLIDEEERERQRIKEFLSRLDKEEKEVERGWRTRENQIKKREQFDFRIKSKNKEVFFNDLQLLVDEVTGEAEKGIHEFGINIPNSYWWYERLFGNLTREEIAIKYNLHTSRYGYPPASFYKFFTSIDLYLHWLLLRTLYVFDNDQLMETKFAKIKGECPLSKQEDIPNWLMEIITDNGKKKLC